MALSFPHLWKNEQHADVTLLLMTENATATQLLAKLPAHGLILSHSPVLDAHLQRWLHNHPSDQEKAPGQHHSYTNPTTGQPPLGWQTQQQDDSSQPTDQHSLQDRPQIELVLQDCTELPAAMAVLEALYATKPLPELLSELTVEQQLQAVLLADMWQLPVVSAAAVESLTALAESDSGLPTPARQWLLRMPVYPSCLEPLLKVVLLSKFGDLEAVWCDTLLIPELEDMSLAAMELLLSYDELKVDSEDTVLFTAQHYCDMKPRAARQSAKKVLAPLIRCQYLSSPWLAASCSALNTDNALLYNYHQPLQYLLGLRLACPQQLPSEADIAELVLAYDAPTSWTLPKRAFKRVDVVKLQVTFKVSELKNAVKTCAEQQQPVTLARPHCKTPPLDGTCWDLELECEWDASAEAVNIYSSVGPSNLHRGMASRFVYSVMFEPGVNRPLRGKSWLLTTTKFNYREYLGNFFRVGFMAGGWDEVAWAAKGLPAGGLLYFTLSVRRP